VVAIGVVAGLCVAASDGVCAFALPAFGAVTSGAVYEEGGGPHTGNGLIGAIQEGSIGGLIAIPCVLGACELAAVRYSAMYCLTASGVQEAGSTAIGRLTVIIRWEALPLQVRPASQPGEHLGTLLEDGLVSRIWES
jgi:hypothetical protein